MIQQEFIDQVLERLDIVEIIGRHVSLKRSGQNFTGCCPFHNEKTASFTVSPAKQFYHCFGCGAHGNALRFIIEHTGSPFVDAVSQLAQQAGLELPKESYDSRGTKQAISERQHQRDEQQAAYQLLNAVTDFFEAQQPKYPQVKHYIQQRGLNPDSIKQFQIGYAPGRSPNDLCHTFPSHHTLLQEQGLILTSERNQQLYDRFRDRLIFPIHDTQGRCVGFGGRALDNEVTPKYLNSPETTLFNKSRLLYGLHLARPHFRTNNYAIVVEGYMDVVMLHQHGFKNAVATLGTACNPEHLKLLFRHTETILFCFDGDTAGHNAAKRALEHGLGILQDGQMIRFLFLPTDQDPDSFIQSQGKNAFQELINKAPPLSEVWINTCLTTHPPTHAEGRAALWKQAKNDLNALTHAPLLAKFLREALYERIGQFNQSTRKQHEVSTKKYSTGFNPPRFSFKKGFSSYNNELHEPTLSLARPHPSVWRTALEIALADPALIEQLPTPQNHIKEEEARALCILKSTPLLSTGHIDFQHPNLAPYQTMFLKPQERVNKKEPTQTDFDAITELKALHLKLQQHTSSHALSSSSSPNTMTEAEKEAFRTHYANKKK